jgi:hypothetical protein
VTISAKIFENTSEPRTVTVNLPDDPSERAILDSMGSSGSLIHVVSVGCYEVWRGSDVEKYIVIGASPCLLNSPKKRKSCDLSDKDVKKLVQKGE